MNSQTSFSVIIPVYNRCEFLTKVLSSVLQQSYQDFEIIVVDDYSSKNICNALKGAVDKRISYIKSDRTKGPAGARNAGLAKAKAKYIAFLDSDDEFLPNHLKDSVVVFEKEPDVHIIFGKAVYLTEFGKEVEYMYPNLIKKINRITNVLDKGEYLVFNDFLFKFMLKEGCFFNLSSVVMRREIIDRGFFMDESLEQGEDMEYWQRLSRFFKFAYLKKNQIKYLMHADNISIPRDEESADRLLNQRLKMYGVMLHYDYIDRQDRAVINRNIAKVLFDHGYMKKNRGKLQEAKTYYLRSLKFHLNIKVFKALFAVIFLQLCQLLKNKRKGIS
ncbi:MAG: glycosyltransferase family 2 protein [Candidatus Omnitrophica bacterium]|nr:glycosyltransferase family 2 protein [Candidatus Omnitrophota bacterium]MCM8791346.1 glycosyltransferase family 2 protein [Candidatus Omnitrophota bacterium]